MKRQVLPADETPLNARAVVIALLAVLSGEQPTQAPSAALRFGAFRLRGVAQRYDQVGGAMMLWHDTPEPGGTLADTLAGLIKDIGAGTGAGTPPIFQMRRVKSPTVDVVLIEAYQRAEGAPMLNGIRFAPAVPAPPAPASPLTRLVEITLEWQVVAHLGELLGPPAESGEEPDAAITVARLAPIPARVLH